MNDYEYAEENDEINVFEEWEYDKILKNFPKLNNSKILSMGCGTGNFERHMKGDVTGIDIIQKYVDYCKKSFKCVNADMRNLPFKNGTFDVVFFGFAFHHIVHDYRRVISEIMRVLKPKGVIYLIEPCGDFYYWLINSMLYFRGKWTHTEDEMPLTISVLKYYFKGYRSLFWLDRYEFFMKKDIKAFKMRKVLSNILAPNVILGVIKK